MVGTLCALIFSSALGAWVDHSPSRLRTLLLTIGINRVTVAISCLIWFPLLLLRENGLKFPLFALVLFFSVVEKISRITNTVSMERDWVPTVASEVPDGATTVPYDLTSLNAIMRRIDIGCKLVGPLAVAPYVTALTPAYAVFGIAALSMAGWFVERWCLKQVWERQPRLRKSKDLQHDSPGALHETPTEHNVRYLPPSMHLSCLSWKGAFQFVHLLIESQRANLSNMRWFFTTSIWLPAVCVALFHASILNWGDTIVTWLLNGSYSVNVVTIARATGSICDLGSTVVFPLAVNFLVRRRTAKTSARANPQIIVPKHEAQTGLLGSIDDDDEEGNPPDPDFGVRKEVSNQKLDSSVIKVALWGFLAHVVNLIPATISIFALTATVQTLSSRSLSATARAPPPDPQDALPITTPFIMLVIFLSLSQLGRWTFDLALTQLSQTLVPADKRGAFAGAEIAIIGLFGVVHWGAAAIFHSQGHFQWLALGSFVVVSSFCAWFMGWTRWWERKGTGEIDRKWGWEDGMMAKGESVRMGSMRAEGDKNGDL
ncbi:hypothetical protein MMC10_007728 [Thelotrema lepadinum]|nr:hypothetical protein [Thelotrema lepadinum]